MKKYSMKYREISKGIIDGSFPLLKKRLIIVREFKIFNFEYVAVVFPFLFFALIGIHTKCRKFSLNDIIYLFAHEFAHFEILIKMNFFEKIVFGFKWLFFKKWKSWFERSCDLLVIERGYGEGLLKFANSIEKEKSNEELKKRNNKGYLSSKEIKYYIQKFKNRKA